MKHVFILNPEAGKTNSAVTLKPEIEKASKLFQNEEISVYTTKYPGDAEVYVRNYIRNTTEGVKFYACGGDGTLGEIVNGAIGCENAEVGCIPIGTGNDFVRNFSEKSNFLNIEKQLRGASEYVDVIKYNDKYCINMLNIGFDCNVVAEAARLKRKKFFGGFMSYLGGVLVVLAKKYGIELSVNLNDKKNENGEILLLALANGGFCGGGFHSSLSASLNDGIIDAYLIHKIKRFKFLRLLPSYRTGEYVNKKLAQDCVEHIRGKHFTVENENGFNICSDGEISFVKKAEISIIRKAVKFIIPEGSKMENSTL